MSDRVRQLEEIFSVSKAEIYDKLGLIPPEANRLFHVESRKVQQINDTLYISIPLKYCSLCEIKKGQTLKIFWREDEKDNNPLFIKV